MLSNSIRLTDIARLQMFFVVVHFGFFFIVVAVFIFDVDEKRSRIERIEPTNSNKDNSRSTFSIVKKPIRKFKTIHICSDANRFCPQFFSFYCHHSFFIFFFRLFRPLSVVHSFVRFQTAHKRTNDTSFQSAHSSVKLFFHDQYFLSPFFKAHLYVNMCYTYLKYSN